MHRFRQFRASVAVCWLLALAGCGGEPPSEQPPPMPVGVIEAHPQAVPLTREFVGRLAATRSADVRARVAGVLQRRVYKEGSNVKAGQLLFQIDPTPLRAELDAALAALARAEAEATNAKVFADRARKLVTDGLISQADLDNAEANERSTEAQRKQARADVQSARIRLGYTSVTAPIAGRAAEQQVTEGALVGQNEPTLLTVVEQIDPIYVHFDVPASGLAQLMRVQGSGEVTVAAPSDARVQVVLADGTVYGETGTVDFVGTRVDASTGTVGFRGLVANPDGRLLPGMFVRVRLSLGQRNDAFLVPQAAVLRDPGGAYVWIVGEGDRTVQKRITTEYMQGTDWVVSGLADGDRVIVQGLMRMQSNMVVAPSPVEAQAAPRASNEAD